MDTSVDMSKPFFNEFVVACPRPVQLRLTMRCLKKGIIGGYDLGPHYFHLTRAHAALRDRDEWQR